MVFFKITAIMPEESKVLKIVNHEQFFEKNNWQSLDGFDHDRLSTCAA